MVVCLVQVNMNEIENLREEIAALKLRLTDHDGLVIGDLNKKLDRYVSFMWPSGVS